MPTMKNWLRVDFPDDDALISSLITSARIFVEQFINRQLITATYKYTTDAFPPYDLSIWLIRQPRPYLPQTRQFQGSGGGTIKLPRAPLQAITLIQYIDAATGNQLTLDPSMYLVDNTTEPGRVSPSYGNVWPTTRWQLGAVQITFTAGYGSAAVNVPPTLVTCIQMIVASWYDNREMIQQAKTAPVPMAVKSQLAQFWTGEYL